MKKFLYYLLFTLILITCAKEAFEEETEAPSVFFSIEASASQGGSIDNAGGSLASGSTITITATPEAEYIFTGWTGTSSSENPLTITVNSNLTITANFEKRKYPLTINKEGEGTVKEEIVNTGKSTDYDSGTVVKLTAIPSDEYAFMRWNNDGVLDTLNPIQITIDSNKIVDVNFDYQTARDLVGTWEFDLQESETAKSHGKISMRISIELDILFTMILNNVTTQIYTRLNSLNSSNLVMGNFGVLTNINFSSPTSLSFNVITLPPNSAPPTTTAAIPSATSSNSISLTGGNKISSNSAPFIPPTTAVTSITSGISPTQALSGIVSQVAATTASATTASTTTASTTTASSTTASTTIVSCTISGTLTSGPPSQTVSISTSITDVVGRFTYTCSDTLSITATGLPPGVSMSASGNVATISGTPTGTASGTYNYTVSAVNSTGTASASYDGDITVTLSSGTTSSSSSSRTFNIGVNATSSSDYTLNGDDRFGTVTGGDPDLTFNAGDTIKFNVDATGHPFYLKTSPGTGSGNLISGVSNNGTVSGTVTWTPGGSGTYYYQCSLHSGMVGTIIIN